MTDYEVILANDGDVDSVAELFDAYRQFYGQASDIDGAKAFLGDRLLEKSSVVLLARSGRSNLGFTQLYPSFSSVAMRRIWVLNDLFVAEKYRRSGVARRLLETTAAFVREDGAARMVLATAVGNAAAKTLYEQTGWQADTDFDHYQLPLS